MFDPTEQKHERVAHEIVASEPRSYTTGEAIEPPDDNPHRMHRVATHSPKRDYFWCLDCQCKVDPSTYSSPFKDGAPPFCLMDWKETWDNQERDSQELFRILRKKPNAT